MDFLYRVDWRALFVPQSSLAEIVLRGSVVYLSLFFLMRLVLKRQAGSLGITDLLVVVLIADAAQNAMAGEYRSIPDGILLVGTILFWAYTLDWLGYRFPRFERIVRPPSLLLVRDGRILWRNLREELITEEELISQLREQGVEDLAEVKAARMEGDGRVSVITREPKKGQHRDERPHA